MAVDFDIVKSEDKDLMKNEISSRLQQGWELHGEMQIFPASVEEGAVKSLMYVQAIVKRDRNSTGFKIG